MDRLITATEANQRFSEMLRDVADGESFTITSRGKPVARVAPVGETTEDRYKKQREVLEFFKKQPAIRIKPWKREELYD